MGDPFAWKYAGRVAILPDMQGVAQIADRRVRGGVIRAFSADHVARLTGLSHSQLQYWDKTGFFKPTHAGDRRTPYGRIYSFRDLVGLRTLSVLRKRHKISLQQLRKVARRLSRYGEAPWSELVLYVFRNEVYFREPETDGFRGALSGQYANLPLRSVIHDMAAEAEKLKRRTPEQIGRVERNRYVVHRAWVVSGTRIPTKAIWHFTQAGYSPNAIIREYPVLTRQDIEAALAHEKKLAKRA